MESFKIERSDAEILEFISEHNKNVDADEQVPLPDGKIARVLNEFYHVSFKGKTVNGVNGAWVLRFDNGDYENPYSDEVYFEKVETIKPLSGLKPIQGKPANNEVLTPENDASKFKIGMMFIIDKQYGLDYPHTVGHYAHIQVGSIVYLTWRMENGLFSFKEINSPYSFTFHVSNVRKYFTYLGGVFTPDEN